MSAVVFFDLGDTLAMPRFSGDGSLLGLKVLPFIPDVLDKLRHTEVNNVRLRLGLISNTGAETLDRMHSVMSKAQLLEFFDPALLLFSSVEKMDKNQREFFELAVERADTQPNRCIYVGEKEDERKLAESAELRTSYHPLHVFHVIDVMTEEC